MQTAVWQKCLNGTVPLIQTVTYVCIWLYAGAAHSLPELEAHLSAAELPWRQQQNVRGSGNVFVHARCLCG